MRKRTNRTLLVSAAIAIPAGIAAALWFKPSWRKAIMDAALPETNGARKRKTSNGTSDHPRVLRARLAARRASL